VSGQAAGGNAEIQQTRKKVYEDAGWEVNGPLDGEFTPSKQATLVQQAVLEGTDAIILDSIYQSTAPEAYKAAKDAGIPIVCNFCFPEESSDGVIAVGPSADSIVEDLVPAVVASAGKKDATIALITTDEIESVKVTTEAAETLLEDQCPDCRIVKVPFSTADFTKPVVPSYTNLLRKYPQGTIDAVISPFGPATTPLISLTEQSGRSDFKVFDIYAAAPISTQIKTGQYAPLLAGGAIVSQAFISYADVDALSREFNGDDPVDYSNLPLAVIMKSNATDYVNDDGLWAPDDLESRFHELWGLSD
jgi:ABC-type sugar transport system substrate-binding protein